MSAVRKRRPKWIAPVAAITALVVVIGVAAWFLFFSGGSAATKYQTAEATTETLIVTVSGSGSATAVRTASVTPSVSGTVYDLRVAMGSKVGEGQVLFKIKSDSVEQDLAQQKASLRQAQQGVSNAKLSLMQADQQLDQLEEQTRTPLPSEDDFEIARQRVTVAKRGLTTARSQLNSADISYEQAKDTASDRTVYAPMPGYVTELNVTSGGSTSGAASSSSSSGGSTSDGAAAGAVSSSGSSSSSSSGSAAVVITDVSDVDIPVQINEANISAVKIGQKATVTLDALPDLTLTGVVRRIDQQGASSSGVVTYEVTVKLDVQDKRVKPGMSATAEVTTAVAKDAVTVPNGAVKTDTQGTYVQVLTDAKAAPERVEVVTGLSNDTRTVVTSGLKEGQTVVTGTLGSTTGSSGSSGSSRPGGFFMGGGGQGGR